MRLAAVDRLPPEFAVVLRNVEKKIWSRAASAASEISTEAGARLFCSPPREIIARFFLTPENGNLRSAVINDAFKDVYGYGPSPKDFAFWNAERQKLNSDKVIRRLMITSVYKKTMGRVPGKGDYDYWMPRYETYKEIVEASRAYLYSSNGSKDLAETITRALEAKTGSRPSIDQINGAISKYTKTKAIFDEM